MIRYILNNVNGQLYTFDDSLVTDKVDAAKAELIEKTTKVFEFKSTLASIDLLPERGEKVGQVYMIKSNDEHNGEEYVWAELQDGTQCWELLGSYMRYYTKEQTYNKDEINNLIKTIADLIGNIGFTETKDETFQEDKTYFVMSPTLGTYIPCDVSGAVGELVPPGIYFERNDATVSSELKGIHNELSGQAETLRTQGEAIAAVEAAVQALDEASRALDAVLTSEHRTIPQDTPVFSVIDTEVVHTDEVDKDCDLITVFTLINAMVPVLNKLVQLHVVPPSNSANTNEETEEPQG